MTRWVKETALGELLRDGGVRLLMRRDGVSESRLRQLLRAVKLVRQTGTTTARPSYASATTSKGKGPCRHVPFMAGSDLDRGR